jgi:hypothetical protein
LLKDRTSFSNSAAGVTRNSAMTKGYWDVGARVSYAFGFGERPQAAGGSGAPIMIVQRIGGDASGLLNTLGGGGAENKRLRIELYASVSNLFNAVNPIGYSGVTGQTGVKPGSDPTSAFLLPFGVNRLSAIKKYGSASAESAAAAPNALAKP